MIAIIEIDNAFSIRIVRKQSHIKVTVAIDGIVASLFAGRNRSGPFAVVQ